MSNFTVKKVTITTASIIIGYYAIKTLIPPVRKHESKLSFEMKRKKKGAINAEFFKQLKEIVKIVLPSVFSKEFLLLSLHTSFLVARTFVSIWVARLDGTLVKSIVDRKASDFGINLLKWLGLAIPATYINSMIRYLESKLAIAFRTRLTNHLYGMYMTNDTYYRVENLDTRLQNADQCLTEDASKFCSLLAHLHSQLSKPLLDVVLMGTQLILLAQEKTGKGGHSGVLPTVLALLTVYCTARALKYITPPFGRLVAEQAQLEGNYRFIHSRLISNSEEVAFYGGDKIELSILKRGYLTLVKHMNYIFQLRILYNMVEGFFMKYVWSAVGLSMIAIPAFQGANIGHSPDDEDYAISNRTQDFVTARGLLASAADAVERIMSSYKEITELAGYTTRVHDMLTVFKEVGAGKYQKKTGKGVDASIMENRGTIEIGDCIKFEKVPIISPNGDVLVDSLSFEVQPGTQLLITGPNGCGKSSLFRIIGGLWPAYKGKVTIPPKEQLFYIPQKPYLSLGSLRDQVIYPDTVEDMKRKNLTDEFLQEVMGLVYLQHIVEREGGWDTVNEWHDVLSGGEKQRVAMARLFYHQPKFAILDECTSAVSVDVEGKMYTKATELGITLLTVSHRTSLWKYHNHLLQFDGEGGWNFTELNAEARKTLRDEKVQLEAQLIGVPAKKKRLLELCALLGENTVVLDDEDYENAEEDEEIIQQNKNNKNNKKKNNNVKEEIDEDEEH